MIYISAPFGNYIKTKKTTSVTGTFTLHPRSGRLTQILKTLRYDFRQRAWRNKLGLRNPGITNGLKTHKEGEILSIGAIQPEDWEELNKLISQTIPLELNVSCPNIDERDTLLPWPKGLERFAQRSICPTPIVKVSPLTTGTELKRLYEMGFRRFHASNTYPTEKGGQSGQILKPYTVRIIEKLKEIDSDNYIIAGGGIQTIRDIEFYKNKGADSFSLGTVCFNPYKLGRLLNNVKVIS